MYKKTGVRLHPSCLELLTIIESNKFLVNSKHKLKTPERDNSVL